MSLAVVLINWHDEDRTICCARTLRTWQTLRPQLIVVDNQSTEASALALSVALAPDTPIESPTNLGYGGGNNLGIGRALAGKPKYILLLNTDAEISERDVCRLLERLEANPEISIVGPVIVEEQNGLKRRYIGGRDIARHAVTKITAPDGPLSIVEGYPLRKVDYISGTVFLARTRVFQDVGPLDERYFFSGEIADFCKRASTKGHAAYVDLDIEAHHDIGHAESRLRDTLYVYYTLRNRHLYVTKHHNREKLKYFAFWAKEGTLDLLRALKRGNFAKARAIVLAFTDAYRGRYGNHNAKFL